MKLKLLDELDAGINTLETNFSSSSDTINAKLNDCLSDDKSQFLSSNARQTLFNINQTPEYYDLSLVDELVISELDNLANGTGATIDEGLRDSFQSNLKDVVSFIKENQTCGILRQ